MLSKHDIVIAIKELIERGVNIQEIPHKLGIDHDFVMNIIKLLSDNLG